MAIPIFKEPLRDEKAAKDAVFIADCVLRLMPDKQPIPEPLVTAYLAYSRQAFERPLTSQYILKTWRILNELVVIEISEIWCPYSGDYFGSDKYRTSVLNQIEDVLPRFIKQYRKERHKKGLPTLLQAR